MLCAAAAHAAGVLPPRTFLEENERSSGENKNVCSRPQPSAPCPSRRHTLFGRHTAADGLRRIVSSLAGTPLRVESSVSKHPSPPKVLCLARFERPHAGRPHFLGEISWAAHDLQVFFWEVWRVVPTERFAQCEASALEQPWRARARHPGVSPR